MDKLEAYERLVAMLADPANWGECCGHDVFTPLDLQELASMTLGGEEPEWMSWPHHAETASLTRQLVAAFRGTGSANGDRAAQAATTEAST